MTSFSKLLIYARALRIHQQVKNLLVFVPLVTAQKITNPLMVFKAAIAFLAFSLCASSVYLLNDYLDLQSDRLHPIKRKRPFASGELPLAQGLLLIPLLLLSACAIALFLPQDFLITLLVYYGMTLGYSFRLKRVVIIDVVLLSCLYTVRIIAGLAAVSLDWSFWLLAFSVFLFLSLAFVKRYAELIYARDNKLSDSVNGRRYEIQDMQLIASLGVASGYLAVLVMALYLNSHEVIRLYSNPRVLWLLCPIMLVWISRVWLIAQRGGMNDDPIVFALRDKTSFIMGIIIIAVISAAA